MTKRFLLKAAGFADGHGTGAWDSIESDDLSVVRILKPGAILLLTSGEWSDYWVNFGIRVVREFNYAQVLQSWCRSVGVRDPATTQTEPRDDDESFSQIEGGCQQFIDRLVTQGLVEEIDLYEFNWDLD